MEPEIIRMYSSSPPPLDNGADEEEDDDFGDFGGFSGAGSTNIGFDFASDYNNSEEELKSPYNADYSSSVDSIIAFTAVRYVNDKDSVTEHPNSIKGLPDSAGKEKCEFRRLGSSSVEVNRTEKSEAPHSGILRTDIKALSQDQQIDSCNGERPQCPEVLTNGFASLDAVNPPGGDVLDRISDSKALKAISTHSTDLCLDSEPSTVEDFADFATFSTNQAAQVEETRNQICKNSSEREALSVHESNIINTVGPVESMKEEASVGSCEYEGETCTKGEPVCISKINVVIHEDFKAEQDSVVLEHASSFSSVQTNVNSVGTTENIEGRGEDDTGNNKECPIQQTSDTASPLNLNVNSGQDLGSLPTEEPVPVSEMVKNGESQPGEPSFSDLNEDDFGDFGTVSNGSPAFADGVPVSQESFQTPFEEKNIKPSNECGGFLGRSGDHQQVATVDPSEPNEISSSVLEECQTADPGSGMEIQPPTETENGNDHEFGDFDSVTKRCLDSDEFSDFSSAGCSQATEWNAFESVPKESCTWAAFEDEHTVESPLRKDVWLTHRIDASSAGVEESALHKIDSVSVTTSQESGSKQLHELPTSSQTMLLSRLERIFETCFPAVPVCEIEDDVIPLNLLLEASSTPGRPDQTLSERELLDVWTELQDIHDAYGLRYQWGGSHSNKKLLCSLGIDTRNILFTGNKKQPVIVPMYAAGLGMLEPTKEPLKPISAAEKIASIGQTPPVSPEMNICAPDQFQEPLPPVQFDWSSSGLTNPLDASGGSTLLNLDFFGPVDDSSSSLTTTIPGVDPELYELTTSKLEMTSTTSKVTEAFAKLMSTVEKASTSARKPKKEERLSEEAAQVIASLPDLTFMHAKVLMFPATLTPSASCQDQVD